MEKHRFSNESKSRLASAMLAAGALVLLAEAGHSGQLETDRQLAPRAMAVYDSNYYQASAEGKFDIQFINENYVTTERNYRHRRKILGFIQGINKGRMYERVTFDNACLANTPYDITVGSPESDSSGTFISSSSETKTIAAGATAEVNPSNPDDLIVHVGIAGMSDLNFSGLQTGEKLLPIDLHTKAILDIYGCKSGIVNVYDSSWK